MADDVNTTTPKSLYESMSDLELFPVGFPVLINRFADPSLRANISIATKMKMVDILPTGFILNFANLTGNGSTGSNIESDWLKYDFEFYINEYRRKLIALGIPDPEKTVGVRLWITGDSQGNDNISNQFTDNSISSQINNAIQNNGIGQAHQMARSAGFGNLVSGFSNGSSQMSRALLNVAADGRHVSLPKIWQESTYENNYTFTIKLSSPYGSHKAIQKFIAEPLLRLTCMVSASSSDGLTYGLPPYLFIRAYGLTYLKLAIPQSLQITRGDQDRINKDRQPLDILINLQVTSAIPGFAALTGGTDPGLGVTIDGKGLNTEGLKEDIQFDQMADENVYDWDEFGANVSDKTDPNNNSFDNLIASIFSNTTGPALNTVGGILKSLMPSPNYLASVNPQSSVSDVLKNYTTDFRKTISSGDDGSISGGSSDPEMAAIAPILNNQFRQNIDSIGLGSVMNPFLDKLM